MKLYSNVSIFFVIWFLSILSIAFIGFITIPHSERFSNDFFNSFSNWDGGHYIGIAKFGYSEKFQYAFFPLYPLLIRAVSQITHNFLASSLLINLTATFLGMNILYKLITIEFDKKIAQKAILLVLFFPTSFYFIASYSEGLFFFLAVAAFYFFRRNKLLLATIFASLCGVTRLAGLAVIFALLIEIGLTRRFNRKNWFLLLSFLGFIIYCWFLFQKEGDPFYFLVAETHWQRTLVLPVLGFWDTLINLVKPGFISANLISFLDLMFTILGLGLTIRAFRFLSPAYIFYSLFSLLLPLLTPSLSSMPRFLLVIFPLFILIAKVKNQYLIFAYQTISLMILSIFTMLFINGYWVS